MMLRGNTTPSRVDVRLLSTLLVKLTLLLSIATRSVRCAFAPWATGGTTIGGGLSTTTARRLADDSSSSLFDVPFAIPSSATTIRGTRRSVAEHVALVDASLRDLTGRGAAERAGLDPSSSSPVDALIHDARYVLITHGMEDDPIYNFGNVAALAAFHRSWEDLVVMPSARSVVSRSVDEGARVELMREVTETGFKEGCGGIRVRDDGTFIELVDAVVWNCFDENGERIGQAAFFDRQKCPIIESFQQT